MESFQICKEVTASELKEMHEDIRASRRSLISVSSFRAPCPPLEQSESCEMPTVSQEKIYVNVPSQRKQSSSGPSPSGSILSIEDRKDGASSPQSSLSRLRPCRHSSHGKLGPYCFFPTLLPTQPPDKWEIDYDKYTYGFAWNFSPSEGQFFPPQFVTDLLFRLLHGFAPYKTEHTTSTKKCVTSGTVELCGKTLKEFEHVWPFMTIEQLPLACSVYMIQRWNA